MKFEDQELQRQYDKVIALKIDLPDELRLIFALMDCGSFFKLLEGEESPKLSEILRILTSAELRPALRRWYAHLGPNINPAAREIHDALERITGEALPLGGDEP